LPRVGCLMDWLQLQVAEFEFNLNKGRGSPDGRSASSVLLSESGPTKIHPTQPFAAALMNDRLGEMVLVV
jgi:hypothetical protein